MWIYQLTADGKYSVGYFTPNGVFVAVHAYSAEADAVKQTSYLNGGTAP